MVIRLILIAYCIVSVMTFLLMEFHIQERGPENKGKPCRQGKSKHLKNVVRPCQGIPYRFHPNHPFRDVLGGFVPSCAGTGKCNRKSNW